MAGAIQDLLIDIEARDYISRSRFKRRIQTLDEVVSGNMSLINRLRNHFDKYKTERRKISSAIKEIVEDLLKVNPAYSNFVITNPYKYKLNLYGGGPNGLTYKKKIRLNTTYLKNCTSISLKATILHENLHVIINKAAGIDSIFEIAKETRKKLKKETGDTEHYYDLKSKFEECMYLWAGMYVWHSLSFFTLAERTGLTIPDVYFKCDRCGYEKGYSLYTSDEEAIEDGISKEALAALKTESESLPKGKLTLCICGNQLVKAKEVLSDSVIFVDLEGLYSKSLDDLALSALSHPFAGDPAKVVVKHGGMRRLANYLIPRF